MARMARMQTYEELEQRVKELENEAVERKRAEEDLLETIRRLQLAYDQSIIYAQELNEEIVERKRAEAALYEAREELEQKVEERTAELLRANEELRQEIAERTLVEKALLSSEKRFRELAELLPETVFETDVQGRLTYANHVAFETFGYSPEDIEAGLNAAQMIAPEGRERLYQDIARLMQGETLGLNEYMAQSKDGKKFPVIVNVNAVLDDEGSLVGLRGIMVNITEQKRAEEELLAYHEKLRTLASKLSLAEEQERRRIAIEVHDSIGQTLAFGKIKLAAVRASISSPGLCDTVDEIIELIDGAIQETRSLISDLACPVLYELGFVPAVEWLTQQILKEHGIVSVFEDNGHSKLLSDDVRVLLFQAVRELLVNIAKHAQAHTAKVSISRDGDQIRIDVEDDGVGFDSAEIGPRVGKDGGFGFFSIKERLDPLGGYFEVESKPGYGTRAILLAPLNRNAETKKRNVS